MASSVSYYIAWDRVSRRAAGHVQKVLGAEAGAALDLRRARTTVPDEGLLDIAEAEEVVAVWTLEDPLSVGFEVGFALGLGLPVTSLAMDSEAASLARAVGIGVRPDTTGSTEGRFDLSHLLPEIDGPADLTWLRDRSLAESETGWQCIVGPHSQAVAERVDVETDWTTVRSLSDYRRDSLWSSSSTGLERFVQESTDAANLVWIVPEPPDGVVAVPTSEYLVDATRSAVGVGAMYAQMLSRGPSGLTRPQLRVIRHRAVQSIVSLVPYDTTFGSESELGQIFQGLKRSADHDKNGYVVEQIELTDFKMFEHIELDLSAPSSMPGNWTCIAGINGAGKSSVLQALVIGLLGPERSAELGSQRLRRYPRRSVADSDGAEIRVTVRDPVGIQRQVVVPLDLWRGIDAEAAISHPERSDMQAVWDGLSRQLFVAYGATRNMSDYRDSRHDSVHPLVRRHMTLFDPLSQVMNVEAILDGGPLLDPARGTLSQLLRQILGDNRIPVSTPSDSGALTFRVDGADLDVVDLPDGFRSVVAWLADLCVIWHEIADPTEIGEGDPKRMRGIVLIDEIDLHLHASLQRSIVPALRDALPLVQWIVTTHSPLVLGSFDAAELVLLDATLDSGTRTVERQVLALTSDEIYESLLGTEATSAALESRLRNGDRGAVELIAEAIDRDEDDALSRLLDKRLALEKLRARGSS